MALYGAPAGFRTPSHAKLPLGTAPGAVGDRGAERTGPARSSRPTKRAPRINLAQVAPVDWSPTEVVDPGGCGLVGPLRSLIRRVATDPGSPTVVIWVPHGSVRPPPPFGGAARSGDAGWPRQIEPRQRLASRRKTSSGDSRVTSRVSAWLFTAAASALQCASGRSTPRLWSSPGSRARVPRTSVSR